MSFPSPFQTPSSSAYRFSAKVDSAKQTKKCKEVEEDAHDYSKKHNVSLESAYKKLVTDYDSWKDVEIDDVDLQVGSVLKGKNMTICCNSLLVNGLYNDTIGVCFFNDHNDNNDNKPEPGNYDNEKKSSVVTYKDRTSLHMEHSGDVRVDYGLRHIIEFTGEPYERAYVISSPWLNSRSKHVDELDKTEPILEIRIEDENGGRKRYVIPQDYTQGFRSTACVNVMIEKENENKKATIHRDFVNGFADDTKTLIDSILNLK